MNPYIQMFRMVNVVMGAVGLMVACFMAAGTDGNYADFALDMVICSVVVMLFVAGGNSINDSIDAEIDKVAHPERPVPSGRITVRQAHAAGIALLVSACVLSVATLQADIIVIVIIASVLMYLYEVVLKQRGFIGNITIAVLTGMVFLLGSAITDNLWVNLAPALMAASVSVGREIAKDIEDMEGDVGRYTLPMMVGRRNAARIAAVFFLIGPLLTIAPLVSGTYGPLFLSVIIADAAFLYSAYLTLSDPHAGQKMAKNGMLAGLVAFILGAFRF